MGMRSLLHLLEERDRVGALLVAQLLEAYLAELGHHLRGVGQESGAVGHVHPLLRVAVRRVRLEQKTIRRTPLHDLAQLGPARARYQRSEERRVGKECRSGWMQYD